MLRYLIEKEFKLIMRNKVLPIFVVLLPTIMLLIIPWATDSEVKNIKLAIVDSDHSSTSRRLIEKIKGSQYFIVVGVENSYPTALNQYIEQDKADAIFTIPNHFEKDLTNASYSKVYIAANAVDGMKGMMAVAYLSETLSQFSKQITLETLQIGSSTPVQQIEISSRPMFNTQKDYKAFMVPAIMLMLIVLMCGALPAINIVMEKESGTIEQMNVTPIKKSHFILAKVIPFWMIGYIVLTIGLVIAYLIYGLVPVGSIALIYFVNTIFILVMSGFGLVVSNKSDTVQQGMLIMMFFIIIFVLMSGLLTPISSMPKWAQYFTYINPTRYQAEAMRFIYLKGSSFSDLTPQIVALTIFAIISNSWAILSYKKQG